MNDSISNNMNFRLAEADDLPQLKAVYGKIIENMNQNHIQIWDEIYPCEFFKEDIEKRRLFLLTDGQDIAAAFALCSISSGENALSWTDKQAKALYIDRFGVNVRYVRKGIGSQMLKKAIAAAKDMGADYLRLFVVDINEPAINLYKKNGFRKVPGIYEEVIDEDLVLREFGFEIKIVS